MGDGSVWERHGFGKHPGEVAVCVRLFQHQLHSNNKRDMLIY